MRTLLQAFVRDHHHLVALVDAAHHELKERPARSLPTLAALGRRLRTHLRIEEELLFPAVERLVDDPHFHLTATLRREHETLRELLGHVEHEVAADNFAGALGNLSELGAVLRTHETKEQRVLYPMAGRLLEPADAKVIEQLEAPSF